MHIKEIIIQNFKSFKDFKIVLNPTINILTGVNNSGKTTVLEAISLWTELFSQRIAQAKRDVETRGVKFRDFMLDKQVDKYVLVNQLVSARSVNKEDIFYNFDTKNAILIELTLTDADIDLTIGFVIKTVKGGAYYEVTLNQKGDAHFYKKFNDFFQYLPNSFGMIQATPTANIKPFEEFVTLPKIQLLTRSKLSVEVFRNRLYEIDKQRLLGDLNSYLSKILFDNKDIVEIRMEGNVNLNINTNVKIKLGRQGIYQDISLVGSGTLQVIELLMGLLEGQFPLQTKDLHLLLLDEPDSYIHRDIQQRLLNMIETRANNTQVFICTHNESLIRCSKYEYLFLLEAKETNIYHNITHQVPNSVKKGLQPSPYSQIIKKLGSPTAIDFISALETDKLYLTEGNDDAYYFRILLDKGRAINQLPEKFMFWAFEGVDEIYTKIYSYKDILKNFHNGKSLWDKVVLIFDKDEFTIEQRNKLLQELPKKLELLQPNKSKLHIWSAYTFEATILSDTAMFVRLLQKFCDTKNIKATYKDLHQFTIQGLDSLITNKKQWLTEEKSREISKKLEAKLYNLEKSKGFDLKVAYIREQGTTDSVAFYQNWTKYIESCLTPQDIYQLANKEDVENLVNAILQGLGNDYIFEIGTPSESADFVALLQLTSPDSIWFEEWNELLKL